MQFHLPKPLHGWRAFAGEIAIIVIGVLIALAAQQVVENWHWQRELARSNQAIELELGEAVGQAIVRVRAAPCVEARLDSLATVIDEAAAARRLQPVGRLFLPVYFTWPSGAWQSMMSGEIAGRQDRQRLQALSGAYDFNADLNSEELRELDAWTDLYQLVGPGRPFDAQDAASARSAIRNARLLNRIIALHAIRLTQILRAYGISYDRPSMEMYTNDASRERAGHCQPTGGAEGHYGEAPLKGSALRAIQNPIGKPSE